MQRPGLKQVLSSRAKTGSESVIKFARSLVRTVLRQEETTTRRGCRFQFHSVVCLFCGLVL